MQVLLQTGVGYCERRYFRMYKFLRISENGHFRVDYTFAF